MMTPEEYAKAERKLSRYGHSFDMYVDSKLPQPLARTKAGKIAKRQPGYDKRNKPYYQAPCSFRGIKTAGTTEELQEALQNRDLKRDQAIHQEMEQMRRETTAYRNEQERIRRADEEAQERVRFQQWWQDPSTSFEDKLFSRPHEALQEELKRSDSQLLSSCYVFKGHRYNMSSAAENVGLAYELVQVPSDLPPGSDMYQRQIIGEAKAVQTRVTKSQQSAEKKAKEAWRIHKAQVAAEDSAKKAQREAFIARRNITGEWDVQCDELSGYSSYTMDELSMAIYKDDYQLDAVCEDGLASDDDVDDEEGWEEDTAQRKKAKKDSPSERQRPRFCATSHFGVLEGTMRIYPPRTSRSRTNWTGIKQNPTFEYRWRGRETGMGEIQLDALEYVRSMTFSEHGTRFKGLFDCSFIDGPIQITGTRKTHGGGQKHKSTYQWSDLTNKEHDRESITRWGRW